VKRLSAWQERLIDFLFPAESDTWLAVLRIGLGLEVVLYALSLRDDWNYFLAGTGHGLISRNLGEAILSLESHLVPTLGWLVNLGTQIGLHEETILGVAWICLLVSSCGVLIGLASRFSAILAWFLHLCAAKSGGFVSYGVDNFMTIGLFYLMLSPLPDQYSLDWRLRKSRPRDPQLLGFWRRVLQQRVVGWLECVARAHPPAFQRYRSRDTRKVEIPVPSRGNLHLSVGNRISISYLEQQDEKNLADRHLCNARRDRPCDGNVSLRVHHDHS
jgi:hypothetical protein